MSDLPQIRAVLIGPPGAGKSTVGKALARELNCTFTDTDEVIEKELGKSITDIFLESGEAYFRSIEEREVSRVLKNYSGVIALGGGSILSPVIQTILEPFQNIVVLLNVSLSQAAPRVGFNRDRPLLAVNPRQQWQSLYEKRMPIYSRLAGMIVSTDSKKPTEVALEIADYLEKP